MTALRILVVEDDSVIGLLLGMTLEQMGHVVCAIESTEAGAVSSAERLRPDLMIVDAGLREGDGISAVQRILLKGPMRHLFASADRAGIRARFPQAVVLEKPFSATDLAGAIQRTMFTATPGRTS